MGAGGRRRANDLLTLQGQHWSLLYGRHTAFNSLRFAHRRESSNANTHAMVNRCMILSVLNFGVVSFFTSWRYIETPRLLLSCVKNQLYCTLKCLKAVGNIGRFAWQSWFTVQFCFRLYSRHGNQTSCDKQLSIQIIARFHCLSWVINLWMYGVFSDIHFIFTVVWLKGIFLLGTIINK